MNDDEFNTFINTSGKRGGAVFNFKTSNITAQARAIMAETPFKALSKAHLAADTVKGYYESKAVNEKFHEIAKKYHIEIVE